MEIQKFTSRDARLLLPHRRVNSNKSDAGRALIIAGSEGFYGAAVLTATAAARAGAGYVQLLSDLRGFSSVKHPDFLTADYRKTKLSALKFNAAAIGPGLGINKKSHALLKELAKEKSNVVVDADALSIIAQHRMFILPTSWILTPHEAELGRIIGVSAARIRAKRNYYVTFAQKKLGCIVLLKGHKTLIASPKKFIEIQSGNASLAKAGTGDVLTGIIVAFLAQGLLPVDAAALGAYVHGHMADQWIKKNDALSLIASDLVAMLPSTLLKIRKS